MAQALLIGGIVAGATGQIIGGISANRAASAEAEALQEQGRLSQAEATAEASRRAAEVRKLGKKQALAFMKNGVSLTGTPLLTINDTMDQGQQEVNAITDAGNARANLYTRRAAITKNEGRAQLIGGALSAAGSSGSSYISGKNAGLW